MYIRVKGESGGGERRNLAWHGKSQGIPLSVHSTIVIVKVYSKTVYVIEFPRVIIAGALVSKLLSIPQHIQVEVTHNHYCIHIHVNTEYNEVC